MFCTIIVRHIMTKERATNCFIYVFHSITAGQKKLGGWTNEGMAKYGEVFKQISTYRRSNPNENLCFEKKV